MGEREGGRRGGGVEGGERVERQVGEMVMNEREEKEQDARLYGERGGEK
jgi:hypothetical protein